MKEKAHTLKELQILLRKQKCAFYNHPPLLKEIRCFSWRNLYRRITKENTQKNAKYQRCKILYKMHPKKKENETMEMHVPKKVKLIKDPLPLENHAHTTEKKEIRSILKNKLPEKETEHLEKKTKVYVVRADNIEENTEGSPAFKYFSANRILPEELPNK
ncbi:hypothetical protein NEFER03_1048 [Nematocida sp. LUAm3]|nr:hypothetical protein NEFER03_1048 [Nematocida sp. LUAm3]KAI5175347.1 hypothetical protein NEFER02_1276 [Nematocida sp. LUAm2]KAI5177696.1 hypothetical protein NEFER01_0920 [Nematocida sp. LUAm1]